MVRNFIEKEFKDEKNKRKIQLEKFRSYSIRIPTMIKVNGLINTLVFIKGKNDNVYKYIYDSINNYYNDKFNPIVEDIIEDILLNDRNFNDNIEYQNIVTIDILSYLLLVKNFAVSEILDVIEN
ncbi:CRISPR-associated protein (Cas_Cmr5) [Tepidibacter thalassicus DSM 15285]|uniref:CRISPR type III-B/RAMP module-associated protein Cmr5 n=2 Tax=Tepidibacter TaxID=214904 RepID=A0A1M5TSV1_9FIRM|nr:CRISPR-associated protein (Cas_Cmr5) [Tepidibacter thalassicus DSM 15285]